MSTFTNLWVLPLLPHLVDKCRHLVNSPSPIACQRSLWTASNVLIDLFNDFLTPQMVDKNFLITERWPFTLHNVDWHISFKNFLVVCLTAFFENFKHEKSIKHAKFKNWILIPLLKAVARKSISENRFYFLFWRQKEEQQNCQNCLSWYIL